MENIFALVSRTDKDGNVSIRLGLRLKIAGIESFCPVSKWCEAFDAFEKETRAVNRSLEQMRTKAQTLFGSRSPATGIEIRPDMPPDEIWGILAAIGDEEILVSVFNELDDSQKQAVAEHVLTQCNIFSSKAAVFSRRYDSEAGCMT